MHETQMIHHFALLLFKNYLTIQVGTLQRIHRQYIRYESELDDMLIGIENLNSGYLMHHICHAHTSLRVTQSETKHSTASSEEAGWLI